MFGHSFRHKDTLAGIVFVLFGTLAFLIAQRYPAGTLLDMGPGYFPRALSALLVLLGLGIMARGLRTGGAALATWAFRPLLILTLSMVLFGLLVERIGLVPAMVILIFTSSAAGREFRLREVAVLTALMCLFSVAVFVWGLGMHFPLFAWGF
ncbi:MAG: tripartite tricarboxylate transporter TctB family protein [Candidatus Accumulibacter sp.]|jgi:hypothetical protein|nr:tripartite tricarboxylate transporter TctB family protein [Accumulibacter sp.]